MFLSPSEGIVDNDPFEELTAHIVPWYNGPEEEAEESEGKTEPQEKVTHREATMLLEKLQLYEAHRDEYADAKMPSQLLKYHRLIKDREAASRVN